VVVVNRWREKYAEYARYVDHQARAVTYVTTEVGLGSVPADAAEVVLVERTDDLDAVRAAVDMLAHRHGAPEAVVALKEDDLLVGAQLRREWGCPGQRPEDLLVLQDKYLMCQTVERAGLPVPAFAAAAGPASVLGFAEDHGWPVIVKPRVGSSSAGVQRVDGPGDLASLAFDGTPMLVQEYRADQIFHVDGLFDGERLLCCRASRYLNTCLGFRGGDFLGSVEVDDPGLDSAISTATADFMAALSGLPLVFHLEVFVREDAVGGPQVTFLEVGARTGGAEIPFIWREVHGYDLMAAAMRLQLGESPPPPVTGRDPEVGGWLLVPAPAARPCLVTVATSMVGGSTGPYAESVLRAGDVIPAADAYYEHVGGRFRFRGPSSAAVESSVLTTAREFRVAGVAVELATSAPASA
jgi:hypothetical protein